MDKEIVISIVICSQEEKITEVMEQNISNTIGVPYEIIYIYNEQNMYSIFEAYNLGVEKARGHVICFMHNDIEYLSDNWGEEVEKVLSMPNVGACAVAGANYMRRTPSYYPIGGCYNVMNIVQSTKSEDIEWRTYTNLTEMAVFDGLWFCIKRKCFDQVRFDSQRYDGFHFYDIDMATQLVVNNYRIIGLPSVKIRHKSGGCTNTSWLVNSFKYAKKWEDSLPISCISVEKKEAFRLECKALYSSLKQIFLTKSYKLLFLWFYFAVKNLKRDPITALITVYTHHKIDVANVVDKLDGL